MNKPTLHSRRLGAGLLAFILTCGSFAFAGGGRNGGGAGGAVFTNRPATRAEILRGGLSPERTCYEVTSYHIDVRIDPTEKSIKGSNKIGFTAATNFSKMQVDLFTNMNVDKIVIDDGAEATYTREYNAVFVQLPAEVTQDSKHFLTFYYSGNPIVARRAPWDGGVTWAKDAAGNPWDCVTDEGTGASLWFPNKDHPTGKPGDVTISITVPPGLEDVSNGRLISTNVLPDGWTQYNWHVSYPINNYDITFNIGKFAHFSDTYMSEGGNPLTLDYYVMPENLEKAKVQFQQAKLMLSSYEKYFGPYPFIRDGYKLIECTHTGMEHQSAVAYGNHWIQGYRGNASSAVGLKFDFILVHESAHEWWGNCVSSADHADMWIHESFGAYAESLFVEDHFGRAESLKYINGKINNVRNDRPIVGEYGLNREGSGDMYDKGQLILNTLRDVVDDDAKWISLLRGVQQTLRYKAVSAEDVFGYFRKNSGKDLTGFFEQYFQHTGIPKLIVNVQQRGDVVTASYQWQAEVPDFRMPVKVTLSPGKFDFIYPTTTRQTITLHGVDPEEFKVDTDEFFVTTQLRWAYHDPNQPATDGR